MKPIKLTMTAFGTYPETAVFPFDPEGGLYLIYGSTGAGKTTVFDAVTYALYGETSGDRDRKAESLRSDFADPDTVTSVELELEHDGKIYTVIRKPPQSRPKKRGEGFTVEKASLELVLPDGTVKFKGAQEDIDGFTNLNIGQWRQVVMLAQNEFMSFIKADTDERAKILGNIFETGRFASYRQKLKEKASELSKLTDREKAGIDRDLEKYKTGEESAYRERLNELRSAGNCALYGDGVESVLRNIAEEDGTVLSGLKTEKDSADRRREEITNRFNTASELEKQFANLEKTLGDMETRLSEKESIDALERRNERTSLALNRIKPLYDNLGSDVRKIKTQQAEIETAESELESAERNLEVSLKAYETAKERSGEAAGYSSQADIIGNDLKKYEETDALGKDIADRRRQLSSMKKTLECMEESVEKLKNEVACDEKFLGDNPSADGTRQLLANESESLERLLAHLKSLGKKHRELSDCKRISDEAAEKHAECRENWYGHNRRLTEMQNAYAGGQAATLAKELRPGCPCPVCGSANHPHPAEPVGGVPSYGEVTAAREESDSLLELSHSASEEKSKAEADYVACAASLREMLKTAGLDDDSYSENLGETIRGKEKSVADDKKRVDSDLQKLNGLAARLGAVSAGLPAKKKNLADSESETDSLKNGISQLELTVNTLESQLSTLKRDLAFPGKKEAEAEIGRLSKLSSEIGKTIESTAEAKEEAERKRTEKKTSLEEKKSALENLKVTKSASEKLYLDALDECGFPGETDFLSHLAHAKTLKEDMKKVSDYGNVLRNLETSAGVYRAGIAGRTRPENTEKLRADMEEAKSLCDGLGRKIAEVSLRIEDNSRILDKFLEDVKSVGDMLERESVYRNLADVADGKNSLRAPLDHYVLTRRLDSILDSASVHMERMSAGRYEILRKKELEGNARKQALDLEILDRHSNEIRKIETLSGGESFMTSLSLALALSDTIQNNARGKKIEALFVDEGFGSLDEEAVDQAVRVLNTISEGMNVGIISHVPRLRELIDRKVFVEYKPGKGSTIVFDG